MNEHKFHGLLRRQLKKHAPNHPLTEELLPLLQALHETYVAHDEERAILERSLDISSEELLQRNSEIQAIFKAFPDIFLRVDDEGKVLDYKTASITISSLLPKTMIGQTLKGMDILGQGDLFTQAVVRARENKTLITFEDAVSSGDKTLYFEARVKSLLRNQAVIIIRDITERKSAEEQLKFDALHDRLTLLPNRVLLLSRIKSCMERKKRNPDYNFAVLFIDFDRFKLVNDSLGHAAGDKLLVSIAQRLSQSVRGVDTLARLGGDEFVAVLDEAETEKNATVVADRMQKASSQPFFIENKEIFLTLSVGIVLSSDGQKRTAADYIRDADIAMYHAKNNGRAQYSLFTQNMHERALKMLNLEADLRHAVKDNLFVVHYQPIISLSSQKALRMEALVRWVHPEKGIVPPLDFIPLAEETGLIFEIGEFVLRQACRQCKEWHSAGYPEIGVAVNFSAVQFHHMNIPKLIRKILNEAGLAPHFLEIEITESIAIKDLDYTIKTLKALKEMGVRVAIDDFGIGYSSLGSLSEFPIDSLKIDRKFVSNLPKHTQNSCLTTAIIGLAHNLGLNVVGEGIETEDQLLFLTKNLCDEGQGFLFSKPLPAEQTLPLIKQIYERKLV